MSKPETVDVKAVLKDLREILEEAISIIDGGARGSPPSKLPTEKGKRPHEQR